VRCERYEEPLQDILSAAGLGDVTGGGSQVGEGNTIEHCGLYILVTDRERGLATIKESMRRLGAPPGTVI
jgi:hypothetical protein